MKRRKPYVAFEVHIDNDSGGIRQVSMFGVDDDGSLCHVNTSEFGPFDTDLEISQWVWRVIARHLAAQVL